MCAYALSIIARRALAEMQALWLLRRDELDGGARPDKATAPAGRRESACGCNRVGSTRRPNQAVPLQETGQ